MMAKQMAHGEHWHRRGRRNFQLTAAAFRFLGCGLIGGLILLLVGDTPFCPKKFATLILPSTLCSISTGNAWDPRSMEYKYPLPLANRSSEV